MKTGMRLFCLVALLLLAPSMALSWPAVVLYHTDGDTLEVFSLQTSSTREIRLYGVDAPETEQAHGVAAREYLREILKPNVTVEILNYGEPDRHKRNVGIVIYQEKNINAMMVEAGLAWVSPDFCKGRFCKDSRAMQKNARENKRGLWQDANATPPWEWRKAKRTEAKQHKTQ